MHMPSQYMKPNERTNTILVSQKVLVDKPLALVDFSSLSVTAGYWTDLFHRVGRTGLT